MNRPLTNKPLTAAGRLQAEILVLRRKHEQAMRVINAARELAETARVFWNRNIHAVEVRPKAEALIGAIDSVEWG